MHGGTIMRVILKTFSVRSPQMKKIVLLLSITIFGWIGWKLGDRFGLMTAYFSSVAGSLVGVYVGSRINREYLS
jgi:hypothetical protein